MTRNDDIKNTLEAFYEKKRQHQNQSVPPLPSAPKSINNFIQELIMSQNNNTLLSLFNQITTLAEHGGDDFMDSIHISGKILGYKYSLSLEKPDPQEEAPSDDE
jgi:hypothetical protein